MTILLADLSATNSYGTPFLQPYMIEGMVVVHMTETELAQNLASALDRIQSGVEIIVERNVDGHQEPLNRRKDFAYRSLTF